MIRRLGEQDREAVAALLKQSQFFNLYLLGNVEANGFDEEFCEFWGDWQEGRLRGVINRYMNGWTVYGEADADWSSLGAVVDGHPLPAERLQDNPGGVASFLPYLKQYALGTLTEDFLMQLPMDGLHPQSAPAGFDVRKATIEDLPGLIGLFSDAGDMSRVPAAVERPLRDRRVWIALSGQNDPVAAALTNAETKDLAMIGGVYTKPEWRGRGLSQAVVSALCSELIGDGRRPILYWHNPTAGRVYAKLGFCPLGTWRSVRLIRR